MAWLTEQDKKDILNLEDGEMFLVPESDYGKAEIWCVRDCLFLFSIPMYGGSPCYKGVFYSPDKIDEEISSWK